MIKVKELKEDALINVQVNRNYYLMVKAASFVLLQSLSSDEERDEYIKNIMTKKYEELDDKQRTFYTIILLLAEIEKQAKENNMYVEKEVLQPGDEGYKEPTASSD